MITSNVYYGVVEARDSDPKKLGRCKVRIVGIHTENNIILPTKDLPWAYPLMPINSASMSGIGESPTGVVEGTWVAISFRDEHQQHPVMLGTVGGIPEDTVPFEDTVITYTVTQQDTLKDSSGNPVTDVSGNPVLVGPPVEVTKTEVTIPASDIKKASSLTVSDTAIQFIAGREGLASLVKGKTVVSTKVIDPETTIYSYQDVKGIWTIGYGSTFMPDGKTKVTADSTIKAKEATSMVSKHITAEVEKYLKGKITSPVTQQMYDAMVSIAYNAGASRFMQTDVFSAVNAGKYKDAAALIPFCLTKVTLTDASGNKTLVESKGLKARRELEAKYFMSGGIPNTSFTDVVKDVPLPEPVTTPATTVPGDTTVTTNTTNYTVTGFSDPTGKYPTKKLLNEPDTHRLARHDRIYESIVFAKEAARALKVKLAMYLPKKKIKGTAIDWDQPPIPYNAKYPFNQTKVTESGHVIEYDDTPDNERVHTYHKSGTFTEIDRNGTQVNRIVGDSFEILERHGNVIIKGDCNVTIMGNSNIRVENDANLEVLGNLETRVTGKMNFHSKGDVKFETEGNFEILSHKELTIKAKTSMNIKTEGTLTEEAKKIDLNPGAAPTIPIIPDDWEDAAGVPEFGELVTIPRISDQTSNYESPSEGDPTVFRQQAVVRGDVNTQEIRTEPAETVQEAAPTPPVNPTPVSDGKCPNFGIIDGNIQLSPNYKLKHLLGSKQQLPCDQYGKTANQITCNLQFLAVNVLEPIRAKFPNIIITSGFRSDANNKGLVGASKTSKHLTGEAVDMQFSGYNYEKMFETAKIIQGMLPDYDQILLEYLGKSCWIHVSWCQPGQGKNRREIATLDVGPNKFTAGKFLQLR